MDMEEFPSHEYESEPAARGPSRVSEKNKQLAVFCHMIGMLGIATLGLTMFVPLMVWLSKHKVSSFVGKQAKEALNFQLNIFFWTMLAFVPVIALYLTVPEFATYSLLLPVAVLLYGAVLSLQGGRTADEGELYHYPGTFRVF